MSWALRHIVVSYHITFLTWYLNSLFVYYNKLTIFLLEDKFAFMSWAQQSSGYLIKDCVIVHVHACDAMRTWCTVIAVEWWGYYVPFWQRIFTNDNMTKEGDSWSKDFVADLPEFKKDIWKIFSYCKDEVINLKNVIINILSQLARQNWKSR